ncbi:MAG: hypothetical protein JG778_1226 [Thermodesulfobacterium sp.]|nr:hypothetical protein [Thermodesulfobacterium sp.]
MGFEPTYKELKLIFFTFRAAPNTCFEPTYKELKQKMEKQKEKQEKSFEPTYKELKQPIFTQEVPEVFGVLSLPIRN